MDVHTMIGVVMALIAPFCVGNFFKKTRAVSKPFVVIFGAFLAILEAISGSWFLAGMWTVIVLLNFIGLFALDEPKKSIRTTDISPSPVQAIPVTTTEAPEPVLVNCPNCGAPNRVILVGPGKNCKYCGTELP